MTQQPSKKSSRLLRTILVIAITFGVWVFIYAQKESSRDYARETKKQIEELTWQKQWLLDTLNYKQTIQFFQSGTYSDSINPDTLRELLSIDNELFQAKEKLKTIPVPDYTTINQATNSPGGEIKKVQEVKTQEKPVSTWIGNIKKEDFIRLLK